MQKICANNKEVHSKFKIRFAYKAHRVRTETGIVKGEGFSNCSCYIEKKRTAYTVSETVKPLCPLKERSPLLRIFLELVQTFSPLTTCTALQFLPASVSLVLFNKLLN